MDPKVTEFLFAPVSITRNCSSQLSDPVYELTQFCSCQAPTKPSPLIHFTFPRLSKEIINAAYPDAEIAAPNHDLGRKLLNMLPPLSEAIQLCELYLEHGKYMCESLYLSYCYLNLWSQVVSSSSSWVIRSTPQQNLPTWVCINPWLYLFSTDEFCYGKRVRNFLVFFRTRVSIRSIRARRTRRPSSTPDLCRITRILLLVPGYTLTFRSANLLYHNQFRCDIGAYNQLAALW